MKFLLYTLIILSFPVLGQEKVNSRALENAKELVYIGDYKTAYNYLLELYQIDSTSTEINYYLGFASFYANRDKTIALPYFFKGSAHNGNAFYFIGLIYHQEKKFDNAQEAFSRYKNAKIEERLFKPLEVQQQIEKIRTAKRLIKNKVKYQVDNMGPNVNSTYPDYAPIVFANGNKLFFTSRRIGSSFNKKDPNNEYFEDIYYAEKVNDEWQKPINIGAPINSETHDATVSLSPGEDSLYIYRTSTNLIGGNIMLSEKVNGQWTEPTNFSSSINTKNSSESSLSINQECKRIYFSSNREGGYGGKDIYYVQKLPNGEWSLPTNLGSMVNTEQDEDGPFLDCDGITLFFSSKGHENMGGYDLFKTQLLDNGQWTEPENLGYPINSVKDDIFISTSNKKDYFFSSNRNGGFGFSDLYHTLIPKKKNDYIIIKGRVINHQHQASLRASVTVFNQKNNQVEGIYKSDRNTGKFIMALKPDDVYKMLVESKGYYSKTEIIDLTKELSLEDILKTIRLTEITKVEEKDNNE